MPITKICFPQLCKTAIGRDMVVISIYISQSGSITNVRKKNSASHLKLRVNIYISALFFIIYCNLHYKCSNISLFLAVRGIENLAL